MWVTHPNSPHIWTSWVFPGAKPFRFTLISGQEKIHCGLLSLGVYQNQLRVQGVAHGVSGVHGLGVAGFRVRALRLYPCVAALMLCCALACAWIAHCQKHKKTPAIMHALPAQGPFKHKRELHFVFDVGGKLQERVLALTPGNIPTDEAVVVQLNGHIITHLKACPSRWDLEQSIALDSGRMVEGRNVIRIGFLAQDLRPWGLRNVYLRSASLKEKRSLEDMFLMANKLYIERHARAGNLYRAHKKISEMINQRKAEDTWPQGYDDLKHNIDAALVEELKHALRSARMHLRAGNKDQARHIWMKLLNDRIDPFDPQRHMILKEMKQLGIDLNNHGPLGSR